MLEIVVQPILLEARVGCEVSSEGIDQFFKSLAQERVRLELYRAVANPKSWQTHAELHTYIYIYIYSQAGFKCKL